MAFGVKEPCDAGVILSKPASIACSPSVGRWVLAATILGSSMAFIDSTAVNIALPVLQVDLGASVSQLQWVVEAYALFLAALLLVGGSLGDRIGRRKAFAWGIVVFVGASLWCGFAPNPTQLIIARAVQGVGGALLVPGSLAIISASFDESSRGKAIGTWSGFTAITMAVGPVLGGWLVENLSWRWVFFLNLPIAVLVLAIVLTKVPETRDEEATGGIDWLGAVISIIGLGALIYGLIESANLGLTHAVVIGSVALGLVALAAFGVVEGKLSAPMMPLSMFRSRNFSGTNLLTFFLYGALGATLFFVPFNMIQLQGYSATAAGAAWLPFILTIAVLSRWAGGLIQQIGQKPPLVVGPLITSVGLAMMVLPGIGGSYWTTFFPAILVMGLGMAIAVAPLVTVVMGSVESHRAGVASGVNNSISRAAGLVSIAVLGVLVLTSFNSELDSRLLVMDAPEAVVAHLDGERVRLASAEPPDGISPELGQLVNEAIDESFLYGFRVVMGMASILALTGALSALVLIEGRRAESAVLEVS